MTQGPSNERTLAMLCHLSSLSVYVSGIGLIVGPLIVWLMKKDESPLVDDQGREAINFNLNMLILGIVGIILTFFCVGIVVLIVLPVVHLVMTILAAIAANEGRRYRYPLIFRFF